MVLRRDDWLDVARKVDWTPRYAEERELFPEELSGHPWLAHEAWRGWNEAYRTTYREYVANQRDKDAAVLGVRAALSKPRLFDDLDPGWVQLVKFHNGAVALAEYAGAVAELRMARFGRDSAWRTMATLGALDEIRHTRIPLLIGHDLLAHDGNFDWPHKAFHTNEWVILAARHPVTASHRRHTGERRGGLRVDRKVEPARLPGAGSLRRDPRRGTGTARCERGNRPHHQRRVAGHRLGAEGTASFHCAGHRACRDGRLN